MNRRNVLSSLAVVGTGLALGAGFTSDLHAAPLAILPAENDALTAFKKELRTALADHSPEANSMASRVATPVEFISRKETKTGSEVKFKNKAGEYLTVIEKNGRTFVQVTQD